MRQNSPRSRGVAAISLGAVCLLAGMLASAAMPQAPAILPGGISRGEQALLKADVSRIETGLEDTRVRAGAGAARVSDAALFPRAVAWALRYEPGLSSDDFALMQRAIERGRQRAAALAAGRIPWEQKRGRLVRAYVSTVDGSVQPYGLLVPVQYDPRTPIRLDVVLHGSTRPVGMSALRFLSPFDEGDTGGDPPNSGFIELHPLGRVENCYRWAGETDVFEAIEDVCRCYNIDRDRIVLRGMSMGASGTWHIGLKHPDRFVALGPYCGYVDTHRFSETPGMDFVKVGPLPNYQEQMLHMLDSVDYAANAGIVPAIAAIGDRDPFFQAHVIMGAAMRQEGLEMVNLISAGTAHVQDPITFAEQMRRIGTIAKKGLDRAPRHVRFVTWTLKYADCHWVRLLALSKHYKRSELEATADADGTIHVKEPRNVLRFAILSPMLRAGGSRLTVGGRYVALPGRREPAPRRASAGDSAQSGAPGSQPIAPLSVPAPETVLDGIVVERRGARWVYAGHYASVRLTGKRPGLQGPIDDAFTSRFLCVRGTGKPWNPVVQAWADASLRRFAYEWSRYFLGDLPTKDDTAVTSEDCRGCNLILFGDPGSNLWIRKALPSLPLRWTRDLCRIGPDSYSASACAPACICPSPFATRGEAARYLVLNSGHSFHEAELGRLNYLLFPRLGDWAIFKVGLAHPGEPTIPVGEELLASGFWNEQWRFDQEAHQSER